MAQQNIKARYRVTGPRLEMVSYNKASLDENKALVQETVTEEMETYMVYFPQGHSIRVLGKKSLTEMGYHIKPKMVDMNTGEVVDFGGDPYDFAEPAVMVDEDDVEELGSVRRKKTAQHT